MNNKIDYLSVQPAEIIYEIFKFIYYLRPILLLVCKKFNRFFFDGDEKLPSYFAVKIDLEFDSRPDVIKILDNFSVREEIEKKRVKNIIKMFGYFNEIIPYYYQLNDILSVKKPYEINSEEFYEIKKRSKKNIEMNKWPAISYLFSEELKSKINIISKKFSMSLKYFNMNKIYLYTQIIFINMQFDNCMLFADKYISVNELFNLVTLNINYIIETGNAQFLKKWRNRFYHIKKQEGVLKSNLKHYFHVRSKYNYPKKDIEIMDDFFINYISKSKMKEILFYIQFEENNDNLFPAEFKNILNSADL